MPVARSLDDLLDKAARFANKVWEDGWGRAEGSPRDMAIDEGVSFLEKKLHVEFDDDSILWEIKEEISARM